MRSGRIKYFIAAITSTVIWGFFSIPLRNLQAYPSDQILHYRIFTSLIITWVFALLFRRKTIKEDINYLREQSARKQKQLLMLTLAAGVLITGNWFSFIYAVNNVSLKSAAFAYMVCPLITALGGFLILKEHLSKVKLLAISIAVFSILILTKGAFNDVLWSVFIAALYAFYLIIQRIIQHIDKFNMLAVQLFISLFLMLPVYITNFSSFPTESYFWVNIVVISVVFTIIPLFLSMYALIGLSSSTLGIIIYINPVIAFAVAFFYFNEEVNILQVLAYSLLIIAVIIFNSGIISAFLKRVVPNHISKTAN
ncbi:MAG TPA: EamA family transporter [Sphingobacteriaceae bacterium]|nr:EamA family transporter [Sphingobacteriaceae bacterium]